MSKVGKFSRGEHTLEVPMELFALNRQRLCHELHKTGGVAKNAFVVLQGGSDVPRYNTDMDFVFAQVAHVPKLAWTRSVIETDVFAWYFPINTLFSASHRNHSSIGLLELKSRIFMEQ